MSEAKVVPVILSGGSGSRLWPLSRELYPKQLLPLVGERTMLQDTVLRLDGVEALGPPLVVCNDSHRFLVAEQLREIGVRHQGIVLEPVGRNTAPAVAVAAMRALVGADGDGGGRDTVLLVLPADHVIARPELFRQAIAAGMPAARQNCLVTFGVVPVEPETGYGYIRKGDAHPAGATRVDRFVEKPDRATAERYLESGDYLWNSGMFMFRVGSYLDALESFAPEMLDCCRRSVAEAHSDLDFVRLGEEAFRECPSDSIDYAVMEKTDAAVVVPLDAGWSDVGNWASLHDAQASDEQGNVAVGDALLEDCSNTYVHASHRLVAAVGLDEHVVVETADAVMVTPKGRAQDVKKIVDRLREAGRTEISVHRESFRAWGSCDAVDVGQRYQVNRLRINPGASLSKQMHHHRAEHWIVVSGTAKVTRGDETYLLGENESTFIPLGTAHRISNPGKVELEIIEVQSGSYLDDDDIVRYDDTDN